MPEYRIYTIQEDGHINGLPKVIDCRNDETAVMEAQQILDGSIIEVWEKGRVVIRIHPA